MRPLIQYDLDDPPPLDTSVLPTRQPPTKKRKRNPHRPQKLASAPPRKVHVQHWDDPGSAAVGVVYDEQDIKDGGSALAVGSTGTMSDATHVEEYVEEEVAGWDAEYEEEVVEVEVEEEVEEEESRPLTHEEIWDDSALIDAWNSAEAEYKAYHGTSKDWKTEPVNKSPLWYNKPYKAPSKPEPPPLPEDAEPDTAPLDFDSYVPTHDPSLGIKPDAATTVNPATNTPFFVPSPSTTMVSRDEAFSNALSAMYWGGYWTAVYHCQSQTSGESSKMRSEPTEESEIEVDEDEDEEDLVPAQR